MREVICWLIGHKESIGHLGKGTCERCRRYIGPGPDEQAYLRERVAQLIAHRVCCNEEHDPANGKVSGFCVVCGLPWPCEYANPKPVPQGGKS